MKRRFNSKTVGASNRAVKRSNKLDSGVAHFSTPDERGKPSDLTRSELRTQLRLDQQFPVGSKQQVKLKAAFVPRTRHGGVPAVGKRKVARPFAPGASVHLILKSSLAKNSWSLQHRKHRAKIQAILYRHADRLKVRIIRSQNVGNHLHLLVKSREQKPLQDFLRIIAGRIAVTVTGAKKGVRALPPNPVAEKLAFVVEQDREQMNLPATHPSTPTRIDLSPLSVDASSNPASAVSSAPRYRRRFWDHLVWSRMVNWGRDFFHVSQYIEKNQFDLLPTTIQKEIREAWERLDLLRPSAGPPKAKRTAF